MTDRNRLPVIATLIVAIAVVIMIALGVWQLQRMQEKEALLARYAAIPADAPAVVWPQVPADYEDALYRRAQVDCARVSGIEERAGRSENGAIGWGHYARCVLAGGGTADVALGWSVDPVRVRWNGGVVAGTIGPAGNGVKLVAEPAQAGLDQLATPDPRDLPNNHLSYAVQWFLFAATAVVVFWLAVRARWRASAR